MSELLDRVETGEEVVITRTAERSRLFDAPPKRLLAERLDDLAAFRARMPPWSKGSASLLREMRDEEP